MDAERCVLTEIHPRGDIGWAENGAKEGYRGWSDSVEVGSIAGVGFWAVRSWEMRPDARRRSMP
jgi:hypothetical protein